ncbi:MAG: hypothetical protein Q7S52_00605 [bacterium]|nr:hypothetical protein [bacterium]
MKHWKKTLKVLAWLTAGFCILFLLLSYGKDPERITYGATLSKYYAEELGLPWRDVFLAALDELKVKKLRLVAYWPMVEPEQGIFDFSDLDWEMNEARARNAGVILAVGRRLPRWPECHIPDWAVNLSWEKQQKEILAYLAATVERYRSYENIVYWQVENEPFLSVFAKEYCGELDEDFLRKEIALVRVLDPRRPVLVTDSGNLGLWYGAWRSGDAFGTSVYLYLWNPEIGEVKSFYLPSFYKIKKNLATFFLGPKKSMLIELSLEPWLLGPTGEAPLEMQLDRMGIDKFNEVLTFAQKTGFGEQYLWGVEWWYFMKEKGHPEFWEASKSLFSET